MENTAIKIEWEKIIQVRLSHIDDEGFVYKDIFFFDNENKVSVVLDYRTSIDGSILPYLWASRLNVYYTAVQEALNYYISVGDSYEKFTSIILAIHNDMIEKERKEEEERNNIIREYKEREAEEIRRRKLEEEQENARLRAKAQAEAMRKERERKARLKSLPAKDVVGVCRFDFFNKNSDKKGEKILDMVKVNFLICEEYEFEDVMRIQNKILQEVSKRLSENYRFKRYQIPIGCFKAKMFYKKYPKSISIVFTLKDELI